jgi:hypothetical protein
LEKSLQFDAGDDFRLNELASDDEQDERFVLDRPTNPSGTVELYARAALPWGDVLFPSNSWPATLWRESCLVLAGKPQYAMRELDRLYRSPETGPLCALATASLVGFINDDAAKAFAKHGLQRLSVADFRNDYEPLLTDEAVVGAVSQHLLEWLRTLDDEERAALGRVLLTKHSDEFIEATCILSVEPDQSAADLLPPVLDRVWELGLRAKVEAALREISP